MVFFDYIYIFIILIIFVLYINKNTMKSLSNHINESIVNESVKIIGKPDNKQKQILSVFEKELRQFEEINTDVNDDLLDLNYNVLSGTLELSLTNDDKIYLSEGENYVLSIDSYVDTGSGAYILGEAQIKKFLNDISKIKDRSNIIWDMKLIERHKFKSVNRFRASMNY